MWSQDYAENQKRLVDALEPTDSEYWVWDDELKGSGVRVRPSGRRIYLVLARAIEQKRRFPIGPHGTLSAYFFPRLRDQLTPE